MDYQSLWRDGIGFWRVWVITLGRRHGLFETLGKRPQNEGIQVWREAAEALGLVEWRKGRLRPAAGVDRLVLDRRDPDYLAGHLMYGALRSMDYDAFGPYFRRGRALRAQGRPRRQEAVEEATYWDHEMFLRRLPRDVKTQLKQGCDVLELGCGRGAWLRRMGREFPRSRFHGVDPDPASGAPRGSAETFGKSRSADVVYLGEVLHLTDRPRTLSNCARVLRPGGMLLVLEGFLPERVSRRPMESVVFAMQLDQALQGARFMRRSELRLPSAFRPLRFIRLGGCVALACARLRK